jgi:hypothetical protein
MPRSGGLGGGAAIQGGFAFSADISPAQITSNQNDYAPTGYADAVVYRLDLDANRTITGIAGGARGTYKILHNLSSYKLTLSNADTNSSAANRFDMASDVILAPKTSVELVYDNTAQRWKIMARPVLGRYPLWVPAGAMKPRSSNGCAPLATVETSTNKVNLNTLDFDPSADEYAQFTFPAIKGWDKSTITAKFNWKHASTTTNFGVRWQAQGVALSDGDDGDTAYGTAQVVDDTGGTTNKNYWSAETPAITIAGSPATGDTVFMQVGRVGSNSAQDTMAIDAGLIGVVLYLNMTAPTED